MGAVSDACAIIVLITYGLGFVAIAIADIIIGAQNDDKICNKHLDLWLIIAGATVLGLLVLGPLGRREGGLAKLFGFISLLGGLFHFGWLIYGTVLVSKSGKDVCHEVLYTASLASVIIYWCLPLLAPIAVCCFLGSSFAKPAAA